MTPATLSDLLNESGIKHESFSHAPMLTVEDAKADRPPGNEGHTKNLFVRNKKGKMWLFTLHEDREVNLKAISKALNAKHLSFASQQRLMQYMGVIPGAVSAFSILNDVTRAVQFYFDEMLMSHEMLHIHPLVNTMTTSIRRDDLLKFLDKRGHEPKVLPVNIDMLSGFE